MTRAMHWLLPVCYFFGACVSIGIVAFVCWFFSPEAKAQNIVWQGYLPPINSQWMILSLAGAENWDAVERPIGKAGERGRLQFTEARWKQLSTKPFRWADSRQNFAIKETHRVEFSHVLDLIESCQRLHRRPTPYLVAAIHTAGFDAVAHDHIPAKKKDFAQRAENIYHELEIKP